MTPCKNKLDKFTLTELAELLSYYSVYDTTKKSGEDTRPSGPEFKKYLVQRLKELDKATPKPPKEPGSWYEIDLNAVNDTNGVSMVNAIADILNPLVLNGDKAIRRKPKELAREIVLGLMEENLLVGGHMSKQLFAIFTEDPYELAPHRYIRVRGVDWVIYEQIHGVS